MIKIVLIFTLTFFMFQSEVYSSEPIGSLYSVKGIVIDQSTGEVLAGVKVQLEGTKLEAYTNFEGEFEFNLVKEGSYNLLCKMISYQDTWVEKHFLKKVNKEGKMIIQMSPVARPNVSVNSITLG